MDVIATERFDNLVRSLSAGASRRGVLARLTGGLLAALPLAFGGEDAAARNNRKKKKRKRHKRGGSGGTQPPPPTTPTCAPECAPGNACGPDGCGGICGRCAGNEVCDSGVCVCVPACAQVNACGANGCGGSCGTCVPDQTCTANEETVHQCLNGVCIPVTTPCAAAQVCFEHQCCTKRPPPTCRQEPASNGCGGIYAANCSGHCCTDNDGNIDCRSLPCV
jgi:hypothetical protein